MKPCPVDGCREICQDKHVMCREHWKMVPEALQRTIWRLWHGGRPRPGHREACLDAIAQASAKTKGAGDLQSPAPGATKKKAKD